MRQRGSERAKLYHAARAINRLEMFNDNMRAAAVRMCAARGLVVHTIHSGAAQLRGLGLRVGDCKMGLRLVDAP